MSKLIRNEIVRKSVSMRLVICHSEIFYKKLKEMYIQNSLVICLPVHSYDPDQELGNG